MFVDDLFGKKTLAEAHGSSWHSEPEQQTIDATRQSRLNREREPAGSEKIDARLRARNDQIAQYNQTGNFWLKRKDTQEHISDAFVGKAAANAAALELLKQQPELRGNLLITAYGPDEQRDMAEGSIANNVKAPSSPSLAAPKAPSAPDLAETLQQIDRMLESVTSKKSAEIIKAYADQRLTELGLQNTPECKKIMAHVVYESAVRRRAYAQRTAN